MKKRLTECGCNKNLDYTNTSNYMFFENLKTIKKAVDAMLQLDPSQVDQMLSNGHAWAVDHIATSKDDMEEVSGFLTNSVTSNSGQMSNDIAYNSQQPQFVPVTFNNHDEMKNFVREIIRKVDGHYELKSHSGKTLGKGTKAEMEKRDKQVNYFKNLNK